MEGEDAAVTNGAATNGEKVSEEARPKAEWVVARKVNVTFYKNLKVVCL
jgi:hypothetical protein